MEISLLIPIIVAIVMALPGIYAAFVQMKKEAANITKVAQDAAIEIINPLREEVKQVREDAKVLRARVKELEDLVETKNGRIAELEAMVRERDEKIDCMEVEIIDLRDRLEKVEKRRANKPPG